MKLGLTYDDVALIPQYSNVESRLIPSLNTWLTKNQSMKIPILASNMESVIGPELAKVLIANGSVPIFHRFTTKEQKIKWIANFPSCFMSCGITEDDQKEIMEIASTSDLKGIVIDIAHAHDYRVLKFIDYFKHIFPTVDIIAGNVCTVQGYTDLANAGAHAVKVGIGAGAACTTRMVTGFGVPQFSAVYDIAQQAKKLRIPIIADGGIRDSRDIVLALAAGASSVMIGKLFAATNEGAGEGNNHYKMYRGQASRLFQEDTFGGVKEGTVPEGVAREIPVSGSAQSVLDKLLGGVRSGLTYGGAKDIKELQRKAEFIRVTSSYLSESGARL